MRHKYLVFNRFMERGADTKHEAMQVARLNAACVVYVPCNKVIADFRTDESENDERG